MNLFDDKTKEMPPQDFSVRTLMTWAECKDGSRNLINNRVFEAADVQNIIRPRRGHGY